jgi:predicted RNase H-like HicB family nuclease
LTDYLVIYEQGDTSWGAYSPDLPGVAVVGDSREEVERLMGEAIPLHLEALREAGISLPQPRNAAGTVAA